MRKSLIVNALCLVGSLGVLGKGVYDYNEVQDKISTLEPAPWEYVEGKKASTALDVARKGRDHFYGHFPNQWDNEYHLEIVKSLEEDISKLENTVNDFENNKAYQSYVSASKNAHEGSSLAYIEIILGAASSFLGVVYSTVDVITHKKKKRHKNDSS